MRHATPRMATPPDLQLRCGHFDVEAQPSPFKYDLRSNAYVRRGRSASRFYRERCERVAESILEERFPR